MGKGMRSHGGNVKAAARKYNLELDEIIDFSANINFLGPPAVVKEEIKSNLEQIIHYPEPGAKTLCSYLGDYLGVPSQNLIIGNGAVEIIYLISKVINPERALVLAPTFSEYEAAIKSVGGEVELFELARNNKFKLNVEELIEKLRKINIDLMFLCNPNNPTGDLIEKGELKKVLQVAKEEDIFLVVDEAFQDFLLTEEEYTLIQEAVNRGNLLILRSMTKFFAIPGLRIGYGVANSRLIEKLEVSKDPWNVNLFAQQVGARVLTEKEYIRKTKEAINREREFLHRQLKDLPGLIPYPPTVNYIFIDISATDYNSQQLREELAQKGILIRDCSTYHLLGTDFIRVAVRSREDNRRLITELKGLLELGGE